MKTYNHAFTVAFEVPESKHEDPAECLQFEKEKIIASMLKRMSTIIEERGFNTEVFDSFDTFCEEE